MASTSANAAEAKLAAAHKVLLSHKELQLDFQPVMAPKPPPNWLISLIKAIAPIAPYIFWTGVAAGAAFVLWLVVREVADQLPRRRRKASAPAVDWRPDVQAARRLLEDADELAAAGQFGEAIHLLLFRSIEEFSGRRPGAVRPALTSRDIAGLPAMPTSASQAFGRIAQVVERSFFGGREVGAEDFARARGDYETFAFSEGWR